MMNLKARDGEISAETLCKLNQEAWEKRHRHVDEAEQLARQAIQLATERDDAIELAYGKRTLSFCLIISGHYAEAMQLGNEAAAVFEAAAEWAALAFTKQILSRIQWELGDYAGALHHNERISELAEHLGNAHLKTFAIDNRAAGLVHLQRFDEAEQLWKQALIQHKKLGVEYGAASAHNNLAMLHLYRGEYEAATRQAAHALALAKSQSLLEVQVNMLDTQGQIAMKQNHLTEAYHYFALCLAQAQENGYRRLACGAGVRLGRVCLLQGDLDAAIREGERALGLAQRLSNDHDQMNCHQLLADVFQAQAQFEKALLHFRQFHAFHDKLFSARRAQELANMEMRHQTERMQHEADLWRLKSAELEQQVEQERVKVVRALVEAQDATDAANRTKSRFIDIMSHELRTPLNGILGYAQILENSHGLDSQHREQASIINRSGNHLLTLINDILEMSKMRTKQAAVEQRELHLRSFLISVESMMRMSAEQQHLTLRTRFGDQLPAVVLADEKRLRKVLLNLIGNAIKFTPRGAVDFQVQCIGAAHDGSHKVRFEICDSGIGIDSADLPKIFDAFEQVSPPDFERSGIGLGLTISQELVQEMGGRIEVNSHVGQGSRFWFDLSMAVGLNNSLEVADADVVSSCSKPSPQVVRANETEITCPPANTIDALWELANIGDLFTLKAQCVELSIERPDLMPFLTPLLEYSEALEEEAAIDYLKHFLSTWNQL